MTDFRRKRKHLTLPIWSSLVLMALNVGLMAVLIVQLARQSLWLGLILGSCALAISLFGISFYSFLTIKEIQLNRRQSNFVDSVTHELKTPIAALRLYLDTLLLQEPNADDRQEFYATMNGELLRLDQLINQLLEVGRLDALGDQADPEVVQLDNLLRDCGSAAAISQQCNPEEVFELQSSGIQLQSRRLLLEMIFRNLLDNAIKYGGKPPRVHVSAETAAAGRVRIRIRDNGAGVAQENRRRIFQLFVRGSDELQRTRKGTGLGLYIVRTLVGILKGSVQVVEDEHGVGSIFEVTLPGTLPPDSVTALEQSTTAVGTSRNTGNQTQ